ncbi:MAG TPA: HAD domain-containing protein [Conexibacter sp.]|nr:HAD domain-containing protein [Conexibacter sp.]
MHALPARPLLLVDVDGVISLFGFPLDARPAGRFEMVDGIAHFLSASAGEHLRQLADAFEPVWCTGWEEKANEYLPGALGLDGPWPYLSFERAAGPGASTQGHWKLDAIDAYCETRALAWVDDAHGEACAAWAARREAAGAPTLLVTTEPAVGLTDRQVAALLAWATSAADTSRAARGRTDVPARRAARST